MLNRLYYGWTCRSCWFVAGPEDDGWYGRHQQGGAGGPQEAVARGDESQHEGDNTQVCGFIYIEFGSGSRILDQIWIQGYVNNLKRKI